MTVIEAAKALGIDISSLCAGKGTCGKCKVKIEKGIAGLAPLTDQEMRHLSQEELETNFRLACQTRLTTSTVVFVPERSRIGKQRLQTEGLEVPVKLNPLVRKYHLQLSKPCLSDVRSDEDRLLKALEKDFGLDGLETSYETIKTLPINLRKKDWNITVTLWNDRIISIEPGDTTARCFGFAADIGSTKLAGFLMDLTTGKVVSTAARMNPQIPFGEDILSRISYVMMHGQKAQDDLQKAVVSGVNEIINECCEKASVMAEEICDLTFVGNTAMQMLFLKLWPQYTALAPYPPVARRGIDTGAVSLGLKSHPNANAHFMPIIGGFVGADSVADIIAVNMLESRDVVMDIDIGTNTEIALGNRDLVMTVSCASGPAFEGMEIKHGMRASTGAIERISIDPSSFEVNYQTIGEAPPIGICGSGLVDVLAEMLKTGLVNTKGTIASGLADQTDRLRKTPEGWYEFVVASKNETATANDITITQADVRELQKAKGAMCAGAEILLKVMNLTNGQICKLYVAGAFGNYIDPESARTVGMYPEISIERIHFVGNTAGTGARMCLASKEIREYAEVVSKKVKYYELAQYPEFQKEYVKALYLPHLDLGRYPVTVELLRRLGRIA